MEIFAAVLNCQLWVTTKTKKEKRTHERCVGPLIHVYTFLSSKGEEFSNIVVMFAFTFFLSIKQKVCYVVQRLWKSLQYSCWKKKKRL